MTSVAEDFLTVTSLVAGYTPEVNILNGASIRVGKGEMVTVVGPNGAGKSTLLKTIIGLLQPRSGLVSLLGSRISGLAPNEVVRKGVGYVPQRENVFETMSVRENLEVGLTPNLRLSLQDRVSAMFEL